MKTILEAHRGVCTEAPENTLAAYRLAARQGYGMIELDPRFTADDICVLHHDPTVNRTGRLKTGEKYPIENTAISSLTIEELRELEFGSWFSPEYAGEPLPTLTDVLKFALEAKIPLKFDNVIATHSPKRQEIFFSEIERLNAFEYVGITAASVEFARKVSERLPSVHIHFDGSATEENLTALAEFLPKARLTVWLRHANRHTAWNKTPPVSAESAARVKQIATLGVWILREEAELADIFAICTPDYIETDGSLKP